MSIHVLSSLDIYCDECHRSFGEAADEPATGIGLGYRNASPRVARRDIKTYDWQTIRRGGKLVDLCPKCKSAYAYRGRHTRFKTREADQ